MKLVESYIDHYGHLQQLLTTFQADQLNVIYGLNEAGKSTLFHFIETTLFGFSRKKHEVEHYSPAQIQQYGGYVIVALPHNRYIKVSRYAKRNKGLPTVSQLEKGNEQFVVLDQQLLKQDEFEKLYLSGLSRSMFRDLCALTLDELQATSMKNDEQLNQHLYHATWESSKLIAQLEKKSEDTVTALYRPKGTKLYINSVASKLKQVKDQLLEHETELEYYESAEKRLLELNEQEKQLEITLLKRDQQLHRLRKLESDYPLYEHLLEQKFLLQQLQEQRQVNKPLLQDLDLFLSEFEAKYTTIHELKAKIELIKLDLNQMEQAVEVEHFAELNKLMEQYQAMEALADDIEARYEQAHRLKQFIAQQTFVAGEQLQLEQLMEHYLDSSNIEAQLSELSRFDRQRLHVSEQSLLISKQCREFKDKVHYADEQKEWTESQRKQLETDLHTIDGFMFIPRQIDELIRSEVSYSEAYHTYAAAPSHSSNIKESAYMTSRSMKGTNPRSRLAPIQLIGGVVVIVLALLLVLTQFSFVNLGMSIVMFVVGGLIVFSTFRRAEKHVRMEESNIPVVNQQEYGERLWHALRQLIVVSVEQKHWDEQLDYKLRLALQDYKDRLKQLDKLKHTIALQTEEKFDYGYQLQVSQQQLAAIELEQKNIDEHWHSYLTEHQLPSGATVEDIKRLVTDCEMLVHNATTYDQQMSRNKKDEERLQHYFAALYDAVGHDYYNQAVPKETVIALIRQKHETLQHRIQQIQATQKQLEQLKLQQSFLEAPLIEQEQHIRKQYTLEANSSIAIWQKWLMTEQQCKEIERELYKLELERKQLLSAEDLAIMTTYYEQESYFELVEQAKRLETEYIEQKQYYTQLIEERGQLQERQSRLRKVGERQRLKLEQTQLEQQLADALREYAKYAIMHYVIGETRREFEQEHQPQLLQQASLYISTLTGGKYARLVLDAESKGFSLTNATEIVPIERLSRGTAELVYFSLRLALLTTHQALKDAPLILDDPFVNFDYERQQRVIHFIKEQAKHRQIILLTCHEHIVAVCHNKMETSLITI